MVKKLSVVIPVYRNFESIPHLIESLTSLAIRVRDDWQVDFEAVFVVDGCPEGSHQLLEDILQVVPFSSQLLLHSRNFGSFAAIRSGLQVATGDFFAIIAADMQEPPELVLLFLENLADDNCDLVIGCRENRNDPLLSRFTSDLFWKLYKTLIISEIPHKGVDVFGCNRNFRDHLLRLQESNSSLVGQIYWLGFRRSEVMYTRRKRSHGKSAWTLKKKVDYLLNSVFSFTDLPIQLLTIFGLIGILFSTAIGTTILFARLFSNIPVPGYATTLLTMIFFGGLNALGLGIIGNYAWRAYENTKCRPLAIVHSKKNFNAMLSGDGI